MLPVATPVTIPEASIVAAEVLLLVHVPPVTPSVKVDVAPAHTPEAPAIVPETGAGLTVTTAVVLAEPQEPDTA